MLEDQVRISKIKIQDKEKEISSLKLYTKDFQTLNLQANKLLNLENEKEVLKLKYDYYRNKNDQMEEALKIVQS